MNAQLASDRVITVRLRALADSLPAVLEARPEGVHKARVASRRVREALPVVLAQAPARRSARLRRSFRRVTRALGPLREIDVTLQLLDEVGRSDARTAAVLAELHRRLERERGVRRDQMMARLDQIDFESLVDRIERLMDERADESDEARALPAAIEGTLGLRIARRVRALELAVERAGSLYAVQALHEVRIAVKKLRYTLELAHDMRALRSRRALTVLHAVQERLGRLHDEQVLADWIRRAQRDGEPAAPVSDTIDGIDARCREHHARYLELRTRLLAAAEQALTTVTTPRSPRGQAAEPAATVH
jgi:CHAD domain-containing protein